MNLEFAIIVGVFVLSVLFVWGSLLPPYFSLVKTSVTLV